MKKFKKIMAALLCAAMCVAAFAGCSSNGNSDSDEPSNANSDKKVLKVGMECQYAPYNWSQTDDSNGAVEIANSKGEYAYGYDVIVAKKLCEELGYELEIYKTEWDGLTSGVSSGKLDVAIAGMSVTEKRLLTVDFSEPYFYASVLALTREDTPYANATTLEGLKGAKCTSQLNTIWYDQLQKIPEANIQPAQETANVMLTALGTGKVDLVVTDLPTCQGAIVANPKLKIVPLEGDNPFGVSEEDINIGIALKKGNTELKEALDKVLTTWTEDDRQAMMNEAIKVQPLNS